MYILKSSSALCFLLVSIFFSSCRKDDDSDVQIPTPSAERTEEQRRDEVLQFGNDFIYTSSVIRMQARALGIGGPLGMIRYANQQTGRTGRLMQLPECAQQNFIIDTAGNYRYTLDFGNSCTVNDLIFSRTVSDQGKLTGNTFEGEVQIDFAMGPYENQSNVMKYSGRFEQKELDNKKTWVLTYTYELDLDEFFTAPSSPGGVIQWANSYQGTEILTPEGFTITAQTANYLSFEKGLLRSTVDQPLRYQYSCASENGFFYTAGTENFTFQPNYSFNGDQVVGQSPQFDFTSSYNFDCDNQMKIAFPNGLEHKIDLASKVDAFNSL